MVQEAYRWQLHRCDVCGTADLPEVDDDGDPVDVCESCRVEGLKVDDPMQVWCQACDNWVDECECDDLNFA